MQIPGVGPTALACVTGHSPPRVRTFPDQNPAQWRAVDPVRIRMALCCPFLSLLGQGVWRWR